MAQEQRAVAGPDPVTAVIGPSLRFGAACGTAGFLTGGTVGVLRGTTPFLFATASGIQTFALGTTFWTCRGVALQTGFLERQGPSDLNKASALAGGLSGGLIGLITRGRANVLPATLMWSLFGGVGQMAYNSLSSRPAVHEEARQGFWERMAKRSWSPVTFMSNEEYAVKLKDQLLKVDVEIAVLDDKIAALKKQQDNDAVESTGESKPATAP